MTDDELTDDEAARILAAAPPGWVDEAKRRTAQTLDLIRLDVETWGPPDEVESCN